MVSCNQWLPICLVNFVSPCSPLLPSILKPSSPPLPSLVSKPCSSITVLHRGKTSTLQRWFTGASTEPSPHISIISFRQTRGSSSGKLYLKRPRTEYHEQSFAAKLWNCLLPSSRMLQAPGPFIKLHWTEDSWLFKVVVFFLFSLYVLFTFVLLLSFVYTSSLLTIVSFVLCIRIMQGLPEKIIYGVEETPSKNKTNLSIYQFIYPSISPSLHLSATSLWIPST